MGSIPSSRVDVVVYGAGYTGLLAAYRLLGEGRRVVIVEPEPGISHRVYYSGYGVDGEVYVGSDYTFLVKKLGVRNYRRDNGGLWINGLYLLVDMADKIFGLGGRLITDIIAEPLISISDGEYMVKGVMLSDIDSQLTTTREIIYADNIIDASYNAGFITLLSDRLKLELPINGYGPVSPGSREIVDRTSWVLRGVIAAGLSVAQLIGAPLPFPDIGPLLMSGWKAGELVLKGFNPSNNRSIMYPWII